MRGEVCGRKSVWESGHINNPAGLFGSLDMMLLLSLDIPTTPRDTARKTHVAVDLYFCRNGAECVSGTSVVKCIFAFSQQAAEAIPNITTLACPGVRNECAGAGL